MRSWYDYWKTQEKDTTQLLRDEEINADTILAFVFDMQEGGCPVSFAGGGWHWSSNIRKLASFLYEVKLRELVARIKGHDFAATFDVKVAEYLDKSLDKNNTADSQILQLAAELSNLLKTTLTVDSLQEWCNRLRIATTNLSHSVEIRLFPSYDEAMPLLLKHEQWRKEDNEAMSVTDRFACDYGELN